jgi:hypothetical protein
MKPLQRQLIFQQCSRSTKNLKDWSRTGWSRGNAPKLCIWEVLGTSPSRKSSRGVCHSHQSDAGTVPRLAIIALLQTLSNLLFIQHLTIRRYVAWRLKAS